MELIDWVNERREFIFSKERSDNQQGYKQSVHTWIMNDKGEFLMQKRSPLKKYYPNLWSQTGGGIKSGETSLDACMRECFEELNVVIDKNKLELKLSFQRTFDYVDIYLYYANIELDQIVLQEDEVIEAKYFSVEEIHEMIREQKVAANVGTYFDFFLLTVTKEFEKKHVVAHNN